MEFLLHCENEFKSYNRELLTQTEKGDAMLREQTIKKITDVILPLVKLNIFSQEEVEALQKINEPINHSASREEPFPEKIPELFTLAETAQILKLTVKGVYDLVKAGKLDLIKLGGRTSRISGDDLRKLLRQSRISRSLSMEKETNSPKED